MKTNLSTDSHLGKWRMARSGNVGDGKQSVCICGTWGLRLCIEAESHLDLYLHFSQKEKGF